MPWNFPYYQVARFAAPNLALGNTILLFKHAPQCPRSAQIMEEIFIEAGLPEGAYINIYASNEQVADLILPDPRNHGVSLTGSERAGSAVAAEAGKNLKKVVLELGGSDPYVLLDTPDVAKSANTFFKTRGVGNTGQACNSPKRMIVMDNVSDEFLTSITEAAKKFTPEAPDTEGSRLSPLSSTAAAKLPLHRAGPGHRQGRCHPACRRQALRRWRRLRRAEYGDSADVEEKGMRGYYEELFGPAVIVYKVSSEEEAVEMADGTPSASVPLCSPTTWSGQSASGAQIDSGMVFLNAPEGTREYLPFGGVKRSRRWS